MPAYLSLQSEAPGSTELVLVDGPPFTPWVLAGARDLGNPRFSHQFSGARGTQGRRPASGVPEDREMIWGLVSDGHATKDELAADLSALVSVVDELRRFGGRITWREHHQTYLNVADVMVGAVEITEWGQHEFTERDSVRPAIRATCAPYFAGEGMDVTDGFATDSLGAGDYEAHEGALANLLVAGGQLTPVANPTTENVLVHTARGYLMGDQEVELKVTPGSTISGFKAGVVLKAIDDDNRIEVYVTDNGTSSSLAISKVIAGTPSTTSSGIGTRIAAGTPFWVRGRITGLRIDADYYTTDPALLGPDQGANEEINGHDAGATFGPDVRGQAGLVWTPQHASARLDDLAIRPYVTPYGTFAGAKLGPARHRGAVPGDAPALADVELGLPVLAVEYPFGLFGWWARPRPHNLVYEGGFEGGASGWTAAAVASFMGACTSITRTTAGVSPLFGTAVGVAVCPATANTGPKVKLSGDFYQGETYTARVWVRAPSATTTVRLRVGTPAAGIASSTAVALSTTWTEHTVTWSPTADSDECYLGVEITAATATTFHIDAAQLYPGTEAPTGGRHAQGQGARPPFGVLEAEGFYANTNGTEQTDAGASGGSYMRIASVAGGGAELTETWMIDPALVVPDDYSAGTVSFVAFARLMLSAAFTGGVTAYLSAAPDPIADAADVIWPAEGIGHALVIPDSGNAKWRLARLGTITLPAGGDQPRYTLSLVLDVAAGTNGQALGLDFLILAPARGHVLSPTGKISGEYPYLAFANASPQTFLVTSDQAGYRSIGGAPFNRTSGLGGSELIELPAAELETLAYVSSLIPDNPEDAEATFASEVFERPRVHLRVRPRWSFIREAA